jgi:hypothetical protein
MAHTIDKLIPELSFQSSLLNLTAATAAAAGPTVESKADAWKEEARQVESLVEQYVRVRPRQA